MNPVWTTPHRSAPVDAVVALPGSKSITARALILAALADGPSRLIRYLTISDRAAFRGSLEHILRWDFERIVPGHGDVVEKGGPAALRAAWLG